MHANGYAALTSRDRVQRVVSEFAAFSRERPTTYAARGGLPVNGSVEIRMTGLDDPADVGGPGARPPLLSAHRPSEGRSEEDTAVWLDVLTLPGTPGAEAFLRDVERFLLRTSDGGSALTRVEWSKGWTYTDDEAWSDEEVLAGVVPAAVGPAAWPDADAVPDRLDPRPRVRQRVPGPVVRAERRGASARPGRAGAPS